MTLFGIQALVLFYWHLVLILCYMYSTAPNLMLYRPCGLYCLENRKINIAWGGEGRNVLKMLENRILLPSVSTLLSPIIEDQTRETDGKSVETQV